MCDARQVVGQVGQEPDVFQCLFGAVPRLVPRTPGQMADLDEGPDRQECGYVPVELGLVAPHAVSPLRP